jgi:hypothetical protein
VERAVTAESPWRQIQAWPRPGQGERRIDLEAGPDERAQIARHLGVESVEQLGAQLQLRPWLDGVEVTGEVEARVIRLCGVSLEPYEESVSEPLRIRYLPPDSANLPRHDGVEVTVDLDAEDPPEAGASEGVDLAALVVETLSLGLSPFARKPGVSFEAPQENVELSPFAVLARLTGARGDAS